VGEDGEIHGGEGGGGGGKWGDGEVKEGEMDKEGFDAEAYVKGVLGREGLEGVLRIEGALVGGEFPLPPSTYYHLHIPTSFPLPFPLTFPPIFPLSTKHEHNKRTRPPLKRT